MLQFLLMLEQRES